MTNIPPNISGSKINGRPSKSVNIRLATPHNAAIIAMHKSVATIVFLLLFSF